MRWKVLILVPNVMLRDLIKITLTRNHMDALICNDAGNIRQALTENPPDLLLLDTYLPGQNGLDLVAELKSDHFLQNTRVFIISSLGYSEIVQKAARVGANDFLVKPLDMVVLVERINRCFSRSVSA